MMTSEMVPVVILYAAISLKTTYRSKWEPRLPWVSPEMMSYSGVVSSPRKENSPAVEFLTCLPAAVCLLVACLPVAPCLPAAFLRTAVSAAAGVAAAAEVVADLTATVVVERLAERVSDATVAIAVAFPVLVSALTAACNFETCRLVANRPRCSDLQRLELAQLAFVA